MKKMLMHGEKTTKKVQSLTLAGYPRNDTFHTLNKPKSTWSIRINAPVINNFTLGNIDLKYPLTGIFFSNGVEWKWSSMLSAPMRNLQDLKINWKMKTWLEISMSRYKIIYADGRIRGKWVLNTVLAVIA